MTPFSPAPCPPRKAWRARGLRGWWVKRFSRLLNGRTCLVDENGGLRDRTWIGRHGEDIAERFLQATGHRVLARNFKKDGGGEVDIVAGRGRLLVFVEVKTRARHTKVRPYDAVTPDKQRLIERGANHWLRELRTREVPWRFDVIEVWLEAGEVPQVNHIRDAF